MTKSRFSHTFALTQQEEETVNKLKEKGIGVVEIFRQGLALCQLAEYSKLKVPENLKKWARDIVK